MIEDKIVKLLLHPDQPIEAKIVALSPQLADKKVMGSWWSEECLKEPIPRQIDRDWDWNKHEIDFDGRELSCEKVALITGEGSEIAVQGGMIVSTEPVESIYEAGKHCLLVELLFTAPRNRPYLRKDEQPFVVGVGTQLLIWAAWSSRKLGYGGRLRLDASPDFVKWYGKRHLQKLELEPIVYEGIDYTPMELSLAGAEELLASWEE